MADDDDDRGTRSLRSGTDLFSNSEIEALTNELTALQDIVSSIRAVERSCAAIEPSWKRKSAIIEKLQKENRRVLECSAILEAADQRWRDLRERINVQREARQARINATIAT